VLLLLYNSHYAYEVGAQFTAKTGGERSNDAVWS